jgi:hypothetical protein
MAGTSLIGIRIAVWLEKKLSPLPLWEGVRGRGRWESVSDANAFPGRAPSR